jgi:hypothetical protein
MNIRDGPQDQESEGESFFPTRCSCSANSERAVWLLARMSSGYCRPFIREMEDDRSDGKEREICGLALLARRNADTGEEAQPDSCK